MFNHAMAVPVVTSCAPSSQLYVPASSIPFQEATCPDAAICYVPTSVPGGLYTAGVLVAGNRRLCGPTPAAGRSLEPF